MAVKKEQKKIRKKWLQVLQFLAAYLVAAWTFLQFVDWILIRYSISPYWVDMLLWLFVGIIPSLVIYLYHRERINSGILRLREKIIFPLNVVILAVGLYIGFGTADLGATTKTIEYTTETGEARTALVTKEEFRTGFNIYNFTPKSPDSTNVWLEYGISVLLYHDLLQNKNLNPEIDGNRGTSEKVRTAGYFHDFYIDGEFEVVDSVYTITTYIRNAKNAKVKKQKTFTGKDVLDLIDEISVFVTSTFDSKEFNNPSYLDLKVKEFTSSNLKALEHFRYGQFEKAIKEDSTFALAYLFAGRMNLRFNLGKFEERALADKAYQYRHKLPLQKQGEALVLKYLAYDEIEKAQELIKLQLEVDPSNDSYNNDLTNIYGKTKNVQAYTQIAYDAWENNKNTNNAFSFLNAGIIREDYNNILRQLSTFELLQPNDDYVFSLKLVPQLMKGDLDAAIKTHEKTKLLHPNLENLTKVYDTAISYLKDNAISKNAMRKFEGVYRSTSNEQTQTIWINENTLLEYVSNQGIVPLLQAGENILVSGQVLRGRTWTYEFLKDDSGRIYAFTQESNSRENSWTDWLWKIDESIRKAENLLEKGDLVNAETAYQKAIGNNPKHYYLKEALKHIHYVQNADPKTLQKQYEAVLGTYSKEGIETKRRFWLKDGRLMYKREELPSKELLPISKTRYITMSDLRFIYEFEYKDEQVIASYAWYYNPEDRMWEKYVPENNYLYKD